MSSSRVQERRAMQRPTKKMAPAIYFCVGFAVSPCAFSFQPQAPSRLACGGGFSIRRKPMKPNIHAPLSCVSRWSLGLFAGAWSDLWRRRSPAMKSLLPARRRNYGGRARTYQSRPGQRGSGRKPSLLLVWPGRSRKGQIPKRVCGVPRRRSKGRAERRGAIARREFRAEVRKRNVSLGVVSVHEHLDAA